MLGQLPEAAGAEVGVVEHLIDGEERSAEEAHLAGRLPDLALGVLQEPHVEEGVELLDGVGVHLDGGVVPLLVFHPVGVAEELAGVGEARSPTLQVDPAVLAGEHAVEHAHGRARRAQRLAARVLVAHDRRVAPVDADEVAIGDGEIDVLADVLVAAGHERAHHRGGRGGT